MAIESKWVRSLVGELRSHMLCCMAKKKNKDKDKKCYEDGKQGDGRKCKG